MVAVEKLEGYFLVCQFVYYISFVIDQDGDENPALLSILRELREENNPNKRKEDVKDRRRGVNTDINNILQQLRDEDRPIEDEPHICSSLDLLLSYILYFSNAIGLLFILGLHKFYVDLWKPIFYLVNFSLEGFYVWDMLKLISMIRKS